MAHGALRFPDSFVRRKNFVVRRSRRTAESVAIETRLGHVVGAECRGKPGHGLGAVRRMAGLTALGIRESRVPVRQFTGVERSVADAPGKTAGITAEMRERRQRRHHEPQRDHRKAPAAAAQSGSRHAGRLAAAAATVRSRSIFTKPAGRLGAAAFPTSLVIVGRTFRLAAAASIMVRAAPAGRSPFGAAAAHVTTVRPFIGTAVEVEMIVVGHSE